MNRNLIAVLLAVVTAARALPQTSKPSAHSPATLRIGLWTLNHDNDATVSSAAASVAAIRMCETCAAARLDHQTLIRAENAALLLPGNNQAAAVTLTGAVILTAHGQSLSLSNPVRISARNGALVFSVTLPVETYVERVVASESGPADTTESLKALAMIVRSFALHQAHGHADYDLCDSTHCQLLRWGSISSRQVAAHAATLATSGETLWFHGQRAAAWFHQNCGGRTASPSEVWITNARGREAANKPMPWLTSRIDTYCTASGTREWSASLSLNDLTAALAAAGLARPGWKSISVARRGESGRAVALLVGATEIPAEDFRLAVGRALGWNKILSNWFELSSQGDQFVFHGRGAGHGVGLCQAGSAAMAAQGRDSSQILAQYFPGATVADEATGRAWQSLRGQGFVFESLDPAAADYLPQLVQALVEAESRSGLQPAAPITVRAFPSTTAFRDATLAPGWVAAFTEGNWIATQPLATLAARKLLRPTLRHEFLHALVESQAAAGTPLWLREGLVEAWSGDAHLTTFTPSLKLEAVDRALAHASTEAQSEAAHRAAGWFAQRLLDRYGRGQVVIWLRSGMPVNAISNVSQ
jgi:stage II sporulation protein D